MKPYNCPDCNSIVNSCETCYRYHYYKYYNGKFYPFLYNPRLHKPQEILDFLLRYKMDHPELDKSGGGGQLLSTLFYST